METREIKFRGKNNVNGNFVEGYYNVYNGLHQINSGHTVYVVHPETVGQYTGLKDKNGKEIYEGDIVQSGNGRIWAVYFGHYQYYKDMPAIGFYLWSRLSVFPLYGNLEIIGNIHETPELLNK